MILLKFQEKTIQLKNGLDCVLRSPEGKDAQQVLYEIKQTSGETDFMARYPEEVVKSEQDEVEFLESMLADPRGLMIAAEIDGKLVAAGSFCCIRPHIKYRHRAAFGISILREFWNLGIGSAILAEILKAAKDADYEQIELEVVDGNDRAMRLYRKFGFEVYGTRQKSFRFKDGTYAAEHLMLREL